MNGVILAVWPLLGSGVVVAAADGDNEVVAMIKNVFCLELWAKRDKWTKICFLSRVTRIRLMVF